MAKGKEKNQVATRRRACPAERRRANRQDCALRVCEPHGDSGLGVDEGGGQGEQEIGRAIVIRCHGASSNQQNFLQGWEGSMSMLPTVVASDHACLWARRVASPTEGSALASFNFI